MIQGWLPILGAFHVLSEPAIVLKPETLHGFARPERGLARPVSLEGDPTRVPCTTLCGMDDFVEVKPWGEARLEFLRRFLAFERGIPSQDTLDDVMNGIDPELFKGCFAEWMQTLRDGQPDIIAIDGRHRAAVTTAPRGASRSISCRPGQLVSAWCSAKRRQTPSPTRSPPSRCCSTVIPTSPVPCLAMIGKVETRVERGGKVEAERRHHLSSAKLDPETFAKAVRTHWHIETDCIGRSVSCFTTTP